MTTWCSAGSELTAGTVGCRGRTTRALGPFFRLRVASAYAQYRPDYPDQAVAWALESLPNGGRVLDLAAGTGKLTEAMLRCGVPTTAVLAVEPDDGMRAEFSRQLPEITVLPGSAERIPAREEALNSVLVGQAFHWFTPDRALDEIARVLRPDGVLAVLRNDEDDSVDWVVELVAAIHAAGQVERITWGSGDVPEHPAFSGPQQCRFHWRWPPRWQRSAGSSKGTPRLAMAPSSCRCEPRCYEEPGAPGG